MNNACPMTLDTAALRTRILDTYTRVAAQPEGAFHFHRGARFAAELLRYDPAELRELPELATARFAGVGNPLRIGPVHAGERVLDHACGAGMDVLLAARRVGRTGRVIGVDLTAAMRDCAWSAVQQAGLADRVAILDGQMEHLPVADGSMHLVISNGVLNLAPDKHAVFEEIVRVLRPGGRLYLADVVIGRELVPEARANPTLWAACVAGALKAHELVDLATSVGLTDARIVESFPCFQGTSVARKMADLGIRGVNLFARRQ